MTELVERLRDKGLMISHVERDQIADEIERLRAMTSVSMGVGDGKGQLFVHGDYASIKAAREIVFRMERAEAERDALRKDAERYRWLRDKSNDAKRSDPMVVLNPLDISSQVLLYGEMLDAAIDAAMAKESSKPAEKVPSQREHGSDAEW